MLHLTSPKITIPANTTNPRLTFEHWVASEAGFDGGNLKISVNGASLASVWRRPTSSTTPTTRPS